ncbi:putative transposase [Neisseria meningitidis NM3230]|nr:putative transposase [Neisseria meningitidis NM3230]
MRDFTVWVSYGKWRKNWDIRYCLLHLIHLSSTRLRKCGRILSGICEPFCLITPDLTMHYCPILILIEYTFELIRT